jgi:hypothetical protein
VRSAVRLKLGILLMLFGSIIAPGVWGFGDFPSSVPGVFVAGVISVLIGLFLAFRWISARRRARKLRTASTRKPETAHVPLADVAPELAKEDVLGGRARFLLICTVEVIITTTLLAGYRYLAAQAAFRNLMDSNGNCSAFTCFDAAQALSATHNTPLLITALRAPRWEARRAAAMELQYSSDQNALGPLVVALGDPQPPVRVQAAIALGATDSDIQVDPLIAALKDPDQAVVNAAAQSLKSLARFASSRRSAASSNDQRAHRIIVGMTQALKFRNAATNVFVYSYLIEHGEGRNELLEGVREFGDRSMAEIYLCSGEPTLEAAGVQWTGRNRYSVNPHAVCENRGGPRWARGQD